MITGNEPINAIVAPQGLDGFSLFEGSSGITIRQHFAAMAMQGMAASQFWSENFTNNAEYLERAMRVAVLSADTIIAELNRTEK